MIFHLDNKEYEGATAIEVIAQMKGEDAEFRAAQTDSPIREFVRWSLKKLSDRLPPRELDLSNARVSEEVQARGYLSLRHDYGIGELVE